MNASMVGPEIPGKVSHIDDIAYFVKRVECYNLFEEIEECVASIGMREISDGRRSGPGND